MATDRRVRKVNTRVARLLKDALEAEGMTIEDLGKATGWGRMAGTLVRGEVQRIAPEQAAGLARWLPITQEEILAAYGFDIVVTPERRVPLPVAQIWARMPRSVRSSMLAVMRAAAMQSEPGEAEDS